MIPVIEVGGTHACAALVDPRSWSCGQQHRTELDPHASAAAILDAIATPALQLDVPPAADWIVAIPGPFDYDAGIGQFHDVGKFDSLCGADVRSELANRLQTTGRIGFLNDADAFGLGAWASAANLRRIAALTLGSGVGSAFVEDGALVCDHRVPPEGRADLLIVDGSPLEERCSLRAIVAAYRTKTCSKRPVAEICERARRGESAAREVIDAAFVALGRALAPVFTAFAPELLVLGGGITGSIDLIKPALYTGLDGQSVRLRVESDGPATAMTGAAWYMYHLKPYPA